MWTGAAHREDDPDGVEFVIECFPAMMTDGARGQFHAWTGYPGRLRCPVNEKRGRRADWTRAAPHAVTWE